MAFKTGMWTRKTEVAKDAMTNIQKVNHSEQIYIWWIMQHHLKKAAQSKLWVILLTDFP